MCRQLGVDGLTVIACHSSRDGRVTLTVEGLCDVPHVQPAHMGPYGRVVITPEADDRDGMP